MNLDLGYIENVLTDNDTQYLQTSESDRCHAVTIGQLEESNMASKRADIYQELALLGLYYAKAEGSLTVPMYHAEVWLYFRGSTVQKHMASQMADKTVNDLILFFFSFWFV